MKKVSKISVVILIFTMLISMFSLTSVKAVNDLYDQHCQGHEEDSCVLTFDSSTASGCTWRCSVHDNAIVTFNHTGSSCEYCGWNAFDTAFTISSSGEITAYSLSSYADVVIPSVINSKNVVSIGANVFKNHSEIESIVIPEGVTSVGEESFQYCTSLSTISLPSTLITIGDEAFAYTESLTTINIPSSVFTIGDYAFLGSCIEEINFGSGSALTNLGKGAFQNCSYLESIVIPNGVTKIKESTFNLCSSLTSITFGSSVSSIFGDCLANCESLSTIAFDGTNSTYDINGLGIYLKGSKDLVVGGALSSVPNDVTSIGDYAFRNNDIIECITIPSTCTSIGMYAFSNCQYLYEINIPSTLSTIGTDAFYITTSNYSDVVIKYYGTPTQWGQISNLTANTKTGKIYVKTEVKVEYLCGTTLSYTGTLPTDDKSYFIGDVVNVSSSTLSITNKVFKGWNTSDSATTGLSTYTISVSDAEALKVSFYGIWDSETYTITYHLNGGVAFYFLETTIEAGGSDIDLYPDGKEYVECYKTGYIFNGWFSDSLFTTEIDTIPSTTKQNVDIYASWTKIITSEPASPTYQVSVISSTKFESPSYQWYSVNEEENTIPSGYINYISAKSGDVSTTLYSNDPADGANPYTIVFSFNLNEGIILQFTSTSLITFSTEQYVVLYDGTKYTYKVTPVMGMGMKLFATLSCDKSFSISNIKLTGEDFALLQETSNTLTEVDLTEKKKYYCKITSLNGSYTFTKPIDVVEAFFSGGEDSTGYINSIYQLPGKSITLPSSYGLSNGEAQFSCWELNSVTYNVGDSYTVGTSDVEFVANWVIVIKSITLKSISTHFKFDTYNTSTYEFTYSYIESLVLEDGANYTLVLQSSFLGFGAENDSSLIIFRPNEGYIFSQDLTIKVLSEDLSDVVTVYYNQFVDSTILNMNVEFDFKASDYKTTDYSVIYHIDKIAPTYTSTKQTYTYDGSGKEFEIADTQSVEFSVTYYDSSSSSYVSTLPIIPGTYKIKVNYTETIYDNGTDSLVYTYEDVIDDALEINKAVVVPTHDTFSFVYDGTNQSSKLVVKFISVSSTDVLLTLESVSLKVGTSTDIFTNVGSYNATFIIPTSEQIYYEFEGHSSTYTCDATITVLKVSLPTITGSYTYNGQSQSPTVVGFDNTYMTMSGDTAKVDQGTYFVEFSLDSNHEWNSETDGRVSWMIARAIAVLPTITETYTYNGSSQSPTINGYDSTYMNQTGDTSATNAGEYTITFSLDDNYTWSYQTDGKVMWFIQKVKVTGSLSNNDFVYNATDQSSSLKATFKNISNTDVELSLNRISLKDSYPLISNFINASIYTIEFVISDTTDKTNYYFEGTNEYFRVNVEIKPKDISQAVITLDRYTEVFNGSQYTFNITNVSLGSFTPTYSIVSNSNIAENCGTHTLIISGVSNYTGFATTTYTITKIDVVDDCHNYSKTYDRLNAISYESLNSILSFTGFKGETEVFACIDKLYLKIDNQSYFLYDSTYETNHILRDVGTYTLSYKVEFYNYNTIEGNVGVTISPKEIIVIWNDFNQKDLVYSGSPVVATAKAINVCAGDTCDVSVRVTEEGTNINVGKFTCTAYALSNPNYKLPENTTSPLYEIEKAKVALPSVTGTYIYNGLTQTPTLVGYNPSFMTLSGRTSEVNAATYTMFFTLDSNHRWSGNTNGALTWQIERLFVEVEYTELEFTYNGESQASSLKAYYTDITHTRKELMLYECSLIGSSSTNSIFMNAGSYDLVFILSTGNEQANYRIGTDGDHYHASATIKKLAIDEPTVVGQVVDTGKVQSPKLLGYDSMYMTKSGTTKAKDVGQYTFTIILDSNHEWNIGSDGVIEWSITPAKIIWWIIPIIIGGVLIELIILFILWKIEYDKLDDIKDKKRVLRFLDPINKPINKFLFERHKKDADPETLEDGLVEANEEVSTPETLENTEVIENEDSLQTEDTELNIEEKEETHE